MDAVNYKYLVKNKDNEELFKKDKCDKFDYLVSVGCGVIGGLIDIFLVGDPTESKLVNWTDSKVDTVVKTFAKLNGWNPKSQNVDSINSAIGFLEKKYKVNYDQRKPSDVGNLFNISPNTHHMMSLAHSPDVVGLFFSILNQFTNTSSFIVQGQLITVNTETFELQGGNPIAKVFCGVANWFGHLMSDIAGSSGSHNRGTGIVIPFYELFGFCKFGSFDVNGTKKDLAELAQSAFNSGEDFRFGLTQAIPVVITELLIRLIWALRRKFQYNRPLKDCIPSSKNSDLRIMLIIGQGTLCLLDLGDAVVRSEFGNNPLKLFMRLNLVAWFRLVMLVLKEVFIKLGFSYGLQESLEAFKRINSTLTAYLAELQQIDFNEYRKEIEKYTEIIYIFKNIKNDKELNRVLLNIYEKLNIEKPYQGNFEDFMNDDSQRLVFK